MIDEEGRVWRPLNRTALRDGIADTLFDRDDACQTWEDMADEIVHYLEITGLFPLLQLPDASVNRWKEVEVLNE